MIVTNSDRSICPYDIGDVLVTASAAQPSARWPGTSWTQIKDCFLLAAGDSYEAGSTGGEATHTLTEAELPAYQLSVTAGENLIRSRTGSTPAAYTTTAPSGWGLPNWDTVSVSASSGGGGQPHNNMPPYKAFFMWQRTA